MRKTGTDVILLKILHVKPGSDDLTAQDFLNWQSVVLVDGKGLGVTSY